MRVCMIAYSFYEGDNRVMRYAETLASRGDHVDVLSLRRPGQPRQGMLHGVQIFRIQERTRDEKHKFSYLFRILTFLAKASVRLTEMHLRRGYDVVHVHSVPDFLVFAALAPKLTGARVILDIHDILPEFYASKFQCSRDSLLFKSLVLIERISTAFADHVIVANHLWLERVIERSAPARKCTALINFPDSSIFHPREKRPADGKFILMYPGSLSHHQGLDIAIRAMSLLRDKLPSAELHIFGEGGVYADLISLTSELRLEDRVLFHQPLPIRKIAEAVAQADLGVVPKRSDSFGNEAFSTKILEFMSSAIPVIAAETKVDRYYFNDSLIEFFRNGDEEDLADSILRLAQDEDLRKRQAAAAFLFAERNSWKYAKHKYLDLVDDAAFSSSTLEDAVQDAVRP